MKRGGLALDLGTANTLVYQQGRGVVYDEPTIVALNTRTGDVLAEGREVTDLTAKSPPHVVSSRPMHRGAITDYETIQQMLRHIFRRLGVGRFPKPKVIVCVPSLLTPVERKAVEEAVSDAGAGSITIVEESLAAAIGAGLPIQDPIGNFVVDVGGGVSEMFMVAMGGVVTGKAVKIGGLDMDAAIQQHIRRTHGVAIGDLAAERIKIELGSAYPAAEEREAEVTGREISTGMPKAVVVAPEEIREVLAESVRTIVDTTRACLAESPPELAHDVLETGLFLTGGGAMLKGLDMRLAQECEVPVHLTEQPLRTVVDGAGHLLEYLPEFRSTLMTAGQPE
jgi:rod shape-determining protein MreB